MVGKLVNLEEASNMNMKPKCLLSVIIITSNEEDRIENCLKSVADLANEIIVIDSGSIDKTVEIALKYTKFVFKMNWLGYGIQKQRALDKATGDWVLSIDADEALSPLLRFEIEEIMKNNSDSVVGYRLPWAPVIFGKRLKFGRSSRAPLRLFKRDQAIFSNSLVHEKIILPEGKIKKLKGHLIHNTHRNFGHYLEKNRTYSWLGAQKKFQNEERGFGLTGAIFHFFWVFFQVYILRLGFLDGRIGFLVAIMYSQGSFNKYAGLWTLRKQKALKH